MANTFIKIQTVTVGAGGATTIDFNSIPQTYTDLCIKLSFRTNAASTVVDYVDIRPNNSTSAITARRIQGNGSAAFSASYTSMFLPVAGASATANTFGNAEIYISNYTSSKNKSFSYDAVQETNATTAYQELWSGLWSDTAAITSLIIGNSGSTIQQYSTATLYGIKSS